MTDVESIFGKTEKNYEFRKFIDKVHKPNRRNQDAFCDNEEVMVDEGWEIVVKKGSSDLVINVARDMQDYLLTSMNTSVLLKMVDHLPSVFEGNKHAIVYTTKEEMEQLGSGLSTPGSYRLVCTPQYIIICGNDERGIAHGSYYAEDVMNLKGAPAVRCQDIVRKPVFSPRIVHSGWGMDQYPDTHLRAIAHNGFDAIALTIKDIDKTSKGYQDINNLIIRADSYGIDVYLYSLIESSKHPDEKDAEIFYENIYGSIFKLYPRAKGVVLVGESIEFPSRDERTTGRRYDLPDDIGLPPTKLSPGWWPCQDYPKLVNIIKKVIRKYKPDADIVFWTYNWGWAPEEERITLINSLPDDITVMVTFEMFEQIKRDNVTSVCVDYTISFEGPGKYFASEAKAAHERNIRLYTMSNTAGLTWDFGVVPYEPVPFQWIKRYDALLKAHKDYNLVGLVESHHYGWWPSFICELTKWAFWEPRSDMDEVAFQLACRDFGEIAAPFVTKAWQEWSNAIRYYIPTNEDQYGPFRIGPSYPLIFHPNLSKTFLPKTLKLPSVWYAVNNNNIIFTLYQPFYDPRQTPAPCRIDAEICSLNRMLELWQKGIEQIENALTVTPKEKCLIGVHMLNLGRFIHNCIRTVIHVKEWWKLNMQLMIESDGEKIDRILDEMSIIAEAEILNAENTIPLVETDSRLGWEPSMEYVTDTMHLQWKIEQVRRVISHEIPAYRESLSA